MKAFLWKLKYAAHMSKRIGCCNWRCMALCWEMAGEALYAFPEAINDHPEDWCDEELSYWTD